MKLPHNFHFYDGSGLRNLAFDRGFPLRSYTQLKRQQDQSHQGQYARSPSSRIKSFRKEYRRLMRLNLAYLQGMPPPAAPVFSSERLPSNVYERAVYLTRALRGVK